MPQTAAIRSLPTAIICVSCGFNLQSGERINTAIEDDGAAPAVRPAAGKPAQGRPILTAESETSHRGAVSQGQLFPEGGGDFFGLPLDQRHSGRRQLENPQGNPAFCWPGAISGLVIGAIWAYSVVKMARNAAEDIKDSGGRLTGIPATKQAETVSAISLVINAFSLCGVLLWKLYFSG